MGVVGFIDSWQLFFLFFVLGYDKKNTQQWKDGVKREKLLFGMTNNERTRYRIVVARRERSRERVRMSKKKKK